MNDSPVIPRHQLDHPGVVKVMLSAAASDALRSAGKYHLVLVAQADCTAPAEAQGRMILHCVPLSRELAQAASDVALGRAIARRKKPAKITSP